MDTRADWRIGHGYDLHRLEARPPAGEGRPLVLAGVMFEHDRGPIAHSDGDAVLHAVTDAVLGAVGLEDIGQLFPDTAAENASRNSADFVSAAVQAARGRGYAVSNLDITIILEKPKLADRKPEMRRNLARMLGLDVSMVNIKGKTHEAVDAVGENRAVEVHVVVLMERST
jgi:2-C-methyl-D-erythritol 2,4-cyclodiphosphate synthase